MRNLLTGLDVGTSKVCAIVGESLPDGQLATLGFGIAPCTGLRKGVVVNIEATVDAIKAGLTLMSAGPKVRDLSDLAGTWVEDPEFDATMREQDRVDPELWR